MGNKKNKKEIDKMNQNKSLHLVFTKLSLITLLIVIIVIAVLILINASNGKKELKVANTSVTSERGGNDEELSDALDSNIISETIPETRKTTVTTLSDGIMYSLTDEKIKPDIVIGDNYYDTQLADINQNFSLYEGKIIEIEGFYLESVPYTFVGRYSTSNLCAYCPVGYSYFEYEYHGDKELSFTNENEWLKIVGKLSKGNDGVDYYYIDVLTLEVMNETGKITVEN